jgi:hypothetical protein
MDAQNLLAMVLVTALLMFGIWRWFASRDTREAGRHEEDYKRLATAAADTQRDVAAQLRELSGVVTDLRDRVTAIEKLLRDVP